MNINVTTALRLVVALVMCFVSLFYTRAQGSDACVKSVKVLFPFDSPVLSADYLTNTSAMENLNNIIDLAAENGEVLNVVAYSSPEGNFTYNQKLSQKRAESVKNYIAARNATAAVNVKIVSGDEAWEELRSNVASDTRLTDNAREEILNIIDSDADPDSKEKSLKANSSYKSLYSNYFRGLRYAIISLRIQKSEAVAPQHTSAKSSATVSASGSATGAPIVYYSLNEDFIRPGYMNNSANLKEIHRILSNPQNREKEIVLEGSASPEGPVSANNRLGERRAQNLANWLVGQFPDLEGRIVIRTKGEDWEGLRTGIENCAALDAQAKDELLAIIDSDNTPENKETLLKAHTAYSTVEQEILPYIRYARFAGFEMEQPGTASETEPATDAHAVTPEADTITTQPADTTALPQVDTTGTEPGQEIDTLSPLADSNNVQGDTKAAERERNAIAALTTNLLYDATTAVLGFHTVPLTVGFEVPVAKKWSVYGDYTITAPWHAWNNNADCVELMHWALGGRYYFGGKRVLDGWYASAAAGMGYYDFERNGKGYQGEEILASIGGGYALTFNDHWSINFGLGVGPIYSKYRYYVGRSNNEHLMYQYNGTYKYFGLTDAKITLTYLFWTKKK